MLLHDGHFVDCNMATLRMFHCASKTLFFKLSPDMVSPSLQPDGTDSLSLSLRYIQQAVEEGACRFDWVHQRISGEEFNADVHLSRIEIEPSDTCSGCGE